MADVPTSSLPFREVAPGVLQWSVHHPEKGIDFNGTLVLDAGGNVAVDPPELDARRLDLVWERGGVAHVVITNRHHERHAARLVERTRARTWAPALDAEGLGLRVDETFRDGAELPAGLRAIAIRHSKSPGETALLLPRDGGTLILGDALIGRPPGRLSLLPAPKIADERKAAEGLRVLLDHVFERVVVGDGENPTDGRHAIEDFLAHHGIRPKRRR